MNTILKDADVRRSMAYLAVSVAVSGVRSLVEYVRNRRNGQG